MAQVNIYVIITNYIKAECGDTDNDDELIHACTKTAMGCIEHCIAVIKRNNMLKQQISHIYNLMVDMLRLELSEAKYEHEIQHCAKQMVTVYERNGNLHKLHNVDSTALREFIQFDYTRKLVVCPFN